MPAATPVTSPLALTVAAVVLLLNHVIARPVRTFPAESFVVAVSCTVPPTAMLPLAGLTVTEATGTRATVMLAVPLFPSLVAVMVAEPVALPVTSPLEITVAAVVLLLDQAIARPVRTFPAESFVVALSCFVAPTNRLAVAGLTVTEATGTSATATVTVAVALFPSLVAVIVAAPAATPITSPVASTPAMAALLVAQVMVRPARELPFASSGVAVSRSVPPTRTVEDAGFTTTDITGTGGTATTVTSAESLRLALVATMRADPTPSPCAMPVPETLAIAEAEVVQFTACGALLFDMTTVAVNCTLSPMRSVSCEGLTATDTTPKSGLSGFVGCSQAQSTATVATATRTQVVGKRMRPSGGSRVTSGGSTGVARGSACGSLGALRPRLSPGLPLSSLPAGRGDPAELQVSQLLRNETA